MGSLDSANRSENNKSELGKNKTKGITHLTLDVNWGIARKTHTQTNRFPTVWLDFGQINIWAKLLEFTSLEAGHPQVARLPREPLTCAKHYGLRWHSHTPHTPSNRLPLGKVSGKNSNLGRRVLLAHHRPSSLQEQPLHVTCASIAA